MDRPPTATLRGAVPRIRPVAAVMRALRRAAECSEHPQIEALYLRTASRLLHQFVRQAEALDRRARRLGRAGETTQAEGDSAGADSGPDPDGAEILDRFVAGIYADMRARRSAEAPGASGAGGRESGNGVGPGP